MCAPPPPRRPAASSCLHSLHRAHRAAAPIRDAICANGYERIPYGDLAGRLNAYDTFAMVEYDGNWMYRSLLESPTNYQRTVELFDAINRGEGAGTDGLLRRLPDARLLLRPVGVPDRRPLGRRRERLHVHVAAGGDRRVHRAAVEGMQPGDCDDKCWCEHVALLECVREARGAAPIGRESGLRVGVPRSSPSGSGASPSSIGRRGGRRCRPPPPR